MAVEHFQAYFFGKYFTKYCNNKPLTWQIKRKPRNYIGWLIRLAKYKFTLKYNTGEENGSMNI